ncbi:MAG: hypothetical protein ACRDXX_21555 [Stackebrandtia sp.]
MTMLEVPRVGLVSQSPRISARARSALAEFAEVAGPDPDHPTLHCVVDAGLFHACRGQAGRRGTGIELRRAGSGSTAGEAIAVDDRDGRHTLVLTALDAAAHVLVERELRMLLARRLLADGWLPLHAAAVVTADNTAVLLMGPKRAGKTTALLSLLRAGAGRLMTNDKLFVRCRRGRLIARALPVAARIRGTTVTQFPELEPLWSSRAQLHVDNVRVGAEPGAAELLVPVHPLAKAFRASVGAWGEVDMVFALRFDPDRTRSALKPLDWTTLDEMFARERLDANSIWRRSWLGDWKPGVDPDNERLIREAFASQPGYELTTAPDDGELLLSSLCRSTVGGWAATP